MVRRSALIELRVKLLDASDLSLSGACQEDVAASTSVRHAGLSQARRLADARPKLIDLNNQRI